MSNMNNQFQTASNENPGGSTSDPLASFYQSTVSETRLQRYQLQEHNQDIETLQQRVQHLELHKATQVGQDKIVGFLVGAVILSLLSMLTTVFFNVPQASEPSSQSSTYQANSVQG